MSNDRFKLECSRAWEPLDILRSQTSFEGEVPRRGFSYGNPYDKDTNGKGEI